MTTHYMRVKNKATGHEFDIPAQSFDPEKYSKVDPKRYPETTRPRRPKPNVLKAGRKTAPVKTDKE
ncbi:MULTISPECIES: hypothetical protein [unclassified Microbacterium]|uniref:hypothetical protein n=1 Tax=unclassified Microbacterium TaxID=2609290 RepID=UPI000EAA3D7D|nr:MULTISPECIES: hypothetical protein [unclassified Microbacterium]MBT2485812.1 hypothetical protein [Microbacterium sp. ISL-108]RKN68575.1 hypothetical protein D7252_13940 [Microbacterium sp. CGR2]